MVSYRFLADEDDRFLDDVDVMVAADADIFVRHTLDRVQILSTARIVLISYSRKLSR